MKIKELFENSRDQHQIEIAAAKIVAHAAALLPSTDKNFLQIKLKDVSSALGHLYFRLRGVDVTFVNRDSDIDGSYSHGIKSIMIFVPWGNGGKFDRKSDEIISVLVHELTHALDGSLSGGEALNFGKPYIERTHEINARFSQALLTLNAELISGVKSGQPISKKAYILNFTEIANKHGLISALNGNDENLKKFEDWLTAGLFGHRLKFDHLSMMVRHEDFSSEYKSPYDVPQFRRLIVRLSKMYDFVETKYGKNK